MSSIEEIANREQYTFLALSGDGEVLYSSRRRGIGPMKEFYDTFKNEKSAVFDRVIGSGAARLLKRCNVVSLSTPLISEEAHHILNGRMEVHFGEKVKKIMNRTGDDFCPIEKLSDEYRNFDEFYDALGRFLRIMKGSDS